MHPARGSQESMRISEGAIICRSLPQQNIKASPELLEAIVSISIRPAINAKKNGNALSDCLWSSGEGAALGEGGDRSPGMCRWPRHDALAGAWSLSKACSCLGLAGYLWHSSKGCISGDGSLPPQGLWQLHPHKSVIQSRSNTCRKNRGAVHPDACSVQIQYKVKVTGGKQRNLDSLSALPN